MRKWREIHSLHFLIFSFFPPSLSISYIKNCLILSQNVKRHLLQYDISFFISTDIFCHTWQTKSRLLSTESKRTSIETNQNLCIICQHLQLYSWFLPNIQDTQLSKTIHSQTKIFHTAHQHAIIKFSSFARLQKKGIGQISLVQLNIACSVL